MSTTISFEEFPYYQIQGGIAIPDDFEFLTNINSYANRVQDCLIDEDKASAKIERDTIIISFSEGKDLINVSSNGVVFQRGYGFLCDLSKKRDESIGFYDLVGRVFKSVFRDKKMKFSGLSLNFVIPFCVKGKNIDMFREFVCDSVFDNKYLDSVSNEYKFSVEFSSDIDSGVTLRTELGNSADYFIARFDIKNKNGGLIDILNLYVDIDFCTWIYEFLEKYSRKFSGTDFSLVKGI